MINNRIKKKGMNALKAREERMKSILSFNEDNSFKSNKNEDAINTFGYKANLNRNLIENSNRTREKVIEVFSEALTNVIQDAYVFDTEKLNSVREATKEPVKNFIKELFNEDIIFIKDFENNPSMVVKIFTEETKKKLEDLDKNCSCEIEFPKKKSVKFDYTKKNIENEKVKESEIEKPNKVTFEPNLKDASKEGLAQLGGKDSHIEIPDKEDLKLEETEEELADVSLFNEDDDMTDDLEKEDDKEDKEDKDDKGKEDDDDDKDDDDEDEDDDKEDKEEKSKASKTISDTVKSKVEKNVKKNIEVAKEAKKKINEIKEKKDDDLAEKIVNEEMENFDPREIKEIKPIHFQVINDLLNEAVDSILDSDLTDDDVSDATEDEDDLYDDVDEVGDDEENEEDILMKVVASDAEYSFHEDVMDRVDNYNKNHRDKILPSKIVPDFKSNNILHVFLHEAMNTVNSQLDILDKDSIFNEDNAVCNAIINYTILETLNTMNLIKNEEQREEIIEKFLK